ncbi:Fe2+-dependent dioxygenase [Marinicauda salina]|uniref:Fe2+-dependent dioxygenase n=1 Tax=Marinicauda salina TaxID=2135793 RepID=A0A2U2BRT7_9PROT|nr:Fe2+-dependent dioxygenase [Marinicauda salina]PWE16734.1 Fe2+-dependent dioxygenase [Marinicauda salina]
MLHRLSGVLTEEELAAVRDLAADESAFVEGAATAGWAAKTVKANLQMKPGARADQARRIVETALKRHAAFEGAALPRRILRTMISLYRPGMTYGVHVDDALMGGARSDLSFTVFLSDPESYEGGGLVIHDSDGATEVKLAAGDAVVYPTGALHEVRPVTAGERLAAVGWVRSYVRAAERREILFDLDLAARAVFAEAGKTETYDRLAKTRANLLRMWAED